MANSPEDRLNNLYSLSTNDALAQASDNIESIFKTNLSLDEQMARKEARLSAKHDQAGNDSDLTLGAKSVWNTVNNLWDGKDFTANVEGQEVAMGNKTFEDSGTTMEQSLINRQELINQYNAAEDDPNARHKVYQLRLADGYDEQGNSLYTYKTGIAQTSAAARYKDKYIAEGYEILSEKGFAGAEDWENKWHGNKANLADRTYDYGYNTAGDKIKDTAQIEEGYTEIYNQQHFNQDVTDEQIAKNQEFSQMLSDIDTANYNGGQYNVVDAAQSGFAKAAVSTGDFILDVLTPGGNNDWLDNAKKQENIDKWVGYNRKNATKTLGEATGYWKQGDYASALWEVAKNPEITAESLGMMLEMTVGFGKFSAAGKLLRGAKGAITGAETMTPLLKAMARLEKAKAAGDTAKVAKLRGLVGKRYGQQTLVQEKILQNAGFLAVIGEQANNSLEVRKENNNGKEPTIGEVLAVTAEKVLELGLDRIAFGKITGLDGGARMMKDAFSSSTLAGKNRILAKIGETAAGLSAAGATEAAQEFTQNWGQILSEQLGTEKHPGGFAAIVSSQENIDEVLGASLAGAAGGVHMSAPGQVYGSVKEFATEADTRVDNTRVAYGPNAIQEISEMAIDEDPELFSSFTDPKAQQAATAAIMEDMASKLGDPSDVKAFMEMSERTGTQVNVDGFINNNLKKLALINKIDTSDIEAMSVLTGGVLSRINKNAIEAQKGNPTQNMTAATEAAYEKLLDGKINIDRKVVLEKLMEFHAARITGTLKEDLAAMSVSEAVTNQSKGLSTSAKAKALKLIERMGSVGAKTEDGETSNFTDAEKAVFSAQADKFKKQINDIGKGKTTKQVRDEIFETGFSIGNFSKKSMRDHVKDIIETGITGGSNKVALGELGVFIDSRNVEKIGSGKRYDEDTDTLVEFTPVQQNRHIQSIINDNDKMAEIIQTEMIGPLSKRGSLDAASNVKQLEEMQVKLAEHTKELRAKQIAMRETAEANGTWEESSGSLQRDKEELRDLGFMDGRELRKMYTEQATLASNEVRYKELTTLIEEAKKKYDRRVAYYTNNTGKESKGFTKGEDRSTYYKEGYEVGLNTNENNPAQGLEDEVVVPPKNITEDVEEVVVDEDSFEPVVEEETEIEDTTEPIIDGVDSPTAISQADFDRKFVEVREADPRIEKLRKAIRKQGISRAHYQTILDKISTVEGEILTEFSKEFYVEGTEKTELELEVERRREAKKNEKATDSIEYIKNTTDEMIANNELMPFSEGKYFHMLMNARVGILVNVDGVPVPFYQSSRGTDGKIKGTWYPYLGTYGNWLAKGDIGTRTLENGFGVPAIAAKQKELNEKFPTKASLAKLASPRLKQMGAPMRNKYKESDLDIIYPEAPMFMKGGKGGKDALHKLLGFPLLKGNMSGEELVENNMNLLLSKFKKDTPVVTPRTNSRNELIKEAAEVRIGESEEEAKQRVRDLFKANVGLDQYSGYTAEMDAQIEQTVSDLELSREILAQGPDFFEDADAYKIAQEAYAKALHDAIVATDKTPENMGDMTEAEIQQAKEAKAQKTKAAREVNKAKVVEEQTHTPNKNQAGFFEDTTVTANRILAEMLFKMPNISPNQLKAVKKVLAEEKLNMTEQRAFNKALSNLHINTDNDTMTEDEKTSTLDEVYSDLTKDAQKKFNNIMGNC